jgi:hypothetical protein
MIARQVFEAGRLPGVMSFFSALSIRACHPRPVALKCLTTSGDRRNESGILVGAFCGPRCPGRRTCAPFQNARTAWGSFGSYGESGSTTRSGASARSRFQSLALAGNRFMVGPDFMSGGGAVVLDRDHRVIEHRLAAREIQPMVSQISLALVLVPGKHALIVDTKSGPCKQTPGVVAGHPG